MILPEELRRRAAVFPGLMLLCAAMWLVYRFSPACVAEGSFRLHLPVLLRSTVCPPLPAQNYVILSADLPGPTMPVEAHPDHNLAVRGYEVTDEYRGLVQYDGNHDPLAPQLAGLFSAPRLPSFVSTYQVHDWDWGQMRQGPVITVPRVSALGLKTTPGETLHVPESGYTIGSGCEVLVIYATGDRIALKYTREDNVVQGYTLHIDHICVDPALLALYRACSDAGRGYLPALRPRQSLGRARSDEVVVAIVDSGTFLDPRSRLDWWRDY
jgi:hypothetical protein